MTPTEFYKYQGTGNDFIIIDNRANNIKKDTKTIQQLCHRKFGIGADGLMFLESHDTHDFYMQYYNADGQESSMCGNGGRCLVHFAHFMGACEEHTTFMATDGLHRANVLDDGRVTLQMVDVSDYQIHDNYTFINTGSPHHVTLIQGIADYDVYHKGKQIRNDIYGAAGANVNFVELIDEDTANVRTYERGVEDETLSCGTGVTAVALSLHATRKTTNTKMSLHTPGGILEVQFKPAGQGYTNIWLTGPATQVFKGIVSL